uniref:Ig-like domain-containing protein n=1 Tax=Gasterosteus aculeatus aculeatus TaxID=481459 RepID=A0AAQ4NSP2_GASAC
MGHTLFGALGLFSLNILLYCGHAQDALLHIEPNWSPLFTGEKVSFICDSREGNDTDWNYSFSRNDHLFTTNRTENRYKSSSLTRGDSGEYQCVADHKIRPVTRESNKVSLTVSGESVTLHCRHGDQRKEKNADFYKDKTLIEMDTNHQHTHEITISLMSDGSSYKCRFKDKESEIEYLKCVPRPVLTVSPSWTSPGDSVTLTCSVEPPSAGWRFFWYKAVPDMSSTNNYYTFELLAGGTTGTEQDSYILHGQTHTAGYKCRAERGDPVFYTQYSDVKFVWSGGVNPAASLTVSPHRLQHFSTESLSLICEGNSAEWRVKKADEDGFVLPCSYWGEMTGSTCNTDTRASSGVYWCESETQSSNAANITIHNPEEAASSSVFLVPLVVGLVSGVLLIILLLLFLRRYRKSE